MFNEHIFGDEHICDNALIVGITMMCNVKNLQYFIQNNMLYYV